jgi:hypothetical protein
MLVHEPIPLKDISIFFIRRVFPAVHAAFFLANSFAIPPCVVCSRERRKAQDEFDQPF